MRHAAEQRPALSDPVRAMYRRVITGWAMDALSLRRNGLDRPCERMNLEPVRPGQGRGVLECGRRLAAPPVIGWRQDMDQSAVRA